MRANPQTRDGFTEVANEILEALYRLHLSPNQWQVLLFIIRKTYGFHKKVDYIANSQVVEATGLCKAVVSRAMATLEEAHVIVRRKKRMGLQKDWTLWVGLAELSTPSLELAESSTELAESSTKVSSPAVAQKIKDTIPKDKVLTGRGNGTFESHLEEMKLKYPTLDVPDQWGRCQTWWSESNRKMQRPKTALRNWLDKALEKQKQGSYKPKGRAEVGNINTIGAQTYFDDWGKPLK